MLRISLPGIQKRKMIITDHPEDAKSGIELVKEFQSINGIGNTFAVYLYPADMRMGNMPYDYFKHIQTVTVIRIFLFSFEGGVARGNKEEKVRLNNLYDLIGKMNMPVMNGIKGPTVKAYIFHSGQSVDDVNNF
jgi:hypothetical protein